MSTETKRVYRSRKNRMLSGVAGGLGEYFGIDSTLVRLFFVFGVFFLGIPGTLALAYLILAIVVPEEPIDTIIRPGPVSPEVDSSQVTSPSDTIIESSEATPPDQTE